jgi:hypothetical protein
VDSDGLFGEVGNRTDKLPQGTFHAFGAASMPAETEVMVIDAPEGAAHALSTYRPQTHLICRWPGELAPAFLRRVSKYLIKIRRSAEVAALTWVMGGDAAISSMLPELGQDLAAALAPTGSLTLVGVGASQAEMAESVELLRQLVAPSVTLDAWFAAG